MGYACKDVEKTKKIAKKFVRYQEGAELYSIGKGRKRKRCLYTRDVLQILSSSK